MLEDAWKSIRAALYERTASPLFGAILGSWLVWNHRMILVLFSDESIRWKFNYIDNELYGDLKITFWLLILGPLLTASFFLFLCPYPARWVYQIWRHNQMKLKKVRQKIEDDTPLTMEESRKLRRQMTRLRDEYEEEIRHLGESRDVLRGSESELQERMQTYNKRIVELEASNEELETQLDLARIEKVSEQGQECTPSAPMGQI